MALVDGDLWIGDRKTGTASSVDPKDGRVTGSLALPCREPGGLAGTTGRLWCTEILQALIFEIDPATGETTRRMDAPCTYPGAAAFVDGHLWVHCPFKKQISVTDPADGTTVRWLPAPSKRLSALGAGKGFVLAADREKDRIYLMDPEDGAVLAVLPIDSPFVTGLAFDGRILYAADYQDDRVRRIDLDGVPPFTVESSQRERVTFRHHMVAGGPGEVTGVEVFVALPEDRASQKILGIEPLPVDAEPEVVTDAGGQRYWKFSAPTLAPGAETVFGFTADVEVRRVRWFTDPRRTARVTDIPEEIRTRYLTDKTKYRIEDPAVVETVERIVGEEENLHLIFQRVYRYVIENMEYALSGGWNAAPLLLARKSGSCSEYTILLVALLRAAGIPARYVGSVVQRGEPASVDLVFHRWAEVYLPGLGWFPVDANRGDADWPADQAEGFGFLKDAFLITTTSGGDSDILGWTYNSTARWKQSGVAEVLEWTSAEWEPLVVPEANLAHVRHLAKQFLLNGEEALGIYIYAEGPEFVLTTDDDEGFTCVDDVARFTVFALLHAERTGSEEARRMARLGLHFVLGMQAEDGQFYNFIFPDLSINREGHTSFKDHGYWASRALWALGAGVRYFETRDKEFAGRLEAAANKLLPWYDSSLDRYGQHLEVEGMTAPAWLIKGASDITSEAVLGMLELYLHRPENAMADRIGKLCDGLAEFQVHDRSSLLYGAHPSSVDKPHLWHHWGSRQSMALARAARILKDHPGSASWLASARMEADLFFRRLLDTHIPEEIAEGKVKLYPQIAYGTNAIVLGCLEIFRATGERKYQDMALEAYAWYLGDNPPGIRMYDERRGSCFDGVIGPDKVNRNSGAESTIEALLAIEEMKTRGAGGTTPPHGQRERLSR